jgi:diketogulonate reductase-like aldo/keto reductase
MEECVKQGLTKSIGLSNFNSEQMQRVLDIATIKPVVNQVLILNCGHHECFKPDAVLLT